jgi:hypothetical protein
LFCVVKTELLLDVSQEYITLPVLFSLFFMNVPFCEQLVEQFKTKNTEFNFVDDVLLRFICSQ